MPFNPFAKKPQSPGGGGKEGEPSGGGPLPLVDPKTQIQPEKETPADPVAEAQRLIELKHSKIMDDMEASVPENGNFFTKLGEKFPDGRDARVFIFNKPMPRNVGQDTANVVTYSIRGIRTKIFSPDDLSWTKSMSDFDRKIGGLSLARDGNPMSDSLIIKGLKENLSFSTNPLTATERTAAEQAIFESIEEAKKTSEKTKAKETLMAKQIELNQADEFSGRFNKFIGGLIQQPPAVESTSPAPPPPQA